MRDEDDSARPGEQTAGEAEPPYQALLPNLDRVSPSAFASGTVSRRRINRAQVVLATVALAIAAVVLVQLLAAG